MTTAAAQARPWGDAFRAGLQPRPRLTTSEWADRHRIVPPGTSPEPGAWRTERAPYLREILDAISDPTVERVHIQAASQIGKSEILLCTIGYYAHQEPAPILFVMSGEEPAKGFSKERIRPMFDASPALRGLLAEGARDPSNTVILRQFPGGLLACAWAGSAASLASRPIRVVLGDEIDRWPDTTGRDGDPWAQAVQRSSNFHNRKIIAVSTPTIENLSAIARLYEDSDQRRYRVACPLCGVYQVLVWSGVIYKNAAAEVDLDDVHYKCSECGGRIEEREKFEMLRGGEWKAENPGHRNRGYQISALYSPWVRWADLAREWIKAHTDRDKRGLQEFINLRLGETWTEEGEKISVEALEKNCEHYEAQVPDQVLLLTAGVDVQDNRLELEIVGWGLGRESWGIEYIVIGGDTSTAAPWQRLDAELARTFTKADGRAFGLWCTCIDSGGHRTQEVYEFARARQARNIYPTKGYAGAGKPIVGKPSVVGQLRTLLYPIGADTGKEAVYSRLALPAAGPGYCHWPLDDKGRGYDDEYFKGLIAETRKRKKVDGHTRLVWVKVRERNEPLDIRVLATAAMEMLALNFEQLAADEAKARGAAPVHTSSKPQRRRVLSRGIE